MSQTPDIDTKPEDLPYPKNASHFWLEGTWGDAIRNTVQGQRGGGMDTTIREDEDGNLWLYQFEGNRSDKRRIRKDVLDFAKSEMDTARIEPLPVDELDARDALSEQMRRLRDSEPSL